jgi:hypothetical protein
MQSGAEAKIKMSGEPEVCDETDGETGHKRSHTSVIHFAVNGVA